MKTPSSIPEALKKRAQLKENIRKVENYLNDEYQKVILEFLKNSNEWTSLYAIRKELLPHDFIAEDNYYETLRDLNRALDDLVESGKCRISGDYERWHFNEQEGGE